MAQEKKVALVTMERKRRRQRNTRIANRTTAGPLLPSFSLRRAHRAAHAPEVGAGSLNLRRILLVRGEVYASGGVLGRDAQLAQPGRLAGEVGQVALKCRDPALIAKRHAVARQDEGEVQLLEGFQGGDSFIEEGIAHISEAALHQVAGTHNALLGQEHNGVAAGMAAPEEEKLDLPQRRQVAQTSSYGWRRLISPAASKTVSDCS